MIMLLLTALIVLAIVGLILYGVRAIPGIPPVVVTIIYVVVGVILLVWLLNFVQGGGLHIGRLN